MYWCGASRSLRTCNVQVRRNSQQSLARFSRACRAKLAGSHITDNHVDFSSSATISSRDQNTVLNVTARIAENRHRCTRALARCSSEAFKPRLRACHFWAAYFFTIHRPNKSFAHQPTDGTRPFALSFTAKLALLLGLADFGHLIR